MKMMISFFIHQRIVQTSKQKEPYIDLSSLEQEPDQSDLAIDQAFDQNLAHKQTHPDAQANQTKKKFALLHPINDSLSRQRIQSQGRFEIVSPCKENSKKGRGGELKCYIHTYIHMYIHTDIRIVQTSKEKEQYIDLSSLEQKPDQSDLAIDQAFDQNLAHKQTHPDAQANQTKKKFVLLHPINDSLSRQNVQSQGRFEI